MSTSMGDESAGFDAKATGRISAYLDGELSEDESADFEAHLDEDSEVAEHFNQMKRLLGALGSLPDVEAPPDFYEQVRKKLRRAKKDDESFWGSSIMLPFQVLSIVVILAAAAIFLMTELDRDTQIDRKALEKASQSVEKAPETGDEAPK